MSVKINEQIRPEAKKDILHLEKKIQDFNSGLIEEDKFKHFRLTRGVYGQRQQGVQMIRIKLPYGRMTFDQILKMADVSDKYATGNLHLTTRQDIQLHYVKLEDSPSVWAELEEEDITLREACGNTVRNVTGAAEAGIDPNEPFDITPYAHAFTHYFLRNPICQDMGRKFKASFSSNETDNGYTFMHDAGFIARVKEIDGQQVKGFKVVVAGGLGGQAFVAQTVSEFMPVDEFIPFTEAMIRVFDRYGERSKRFKARMKFLVKQLGLEKFLELVEAEKAGLPFQKIPVDESVNQNVVLPTYSPAADAKPSDPEQYDKWLKTNVFDQKQPGFKGVWIRVLTGDIKTDVARQLVDIFRKYAADDVRVTKNQGLLLRYVKPEALVELFNELHALGFAKPGFDTAHDVTSCPGTDTCNLAVSNSVSLAGQLEKLLAEEYEDLIFDNGIKIKISGCMNACGQHTAASIGLHGSSIKNGALVAPAMQVLLGGGVNADGSAQMADKVVKIPSKKIPDALRALLDEYDKEAVDGEYFNSFYARMGKMHFYHLLKPLADLEQLKAEDYVDWGQTENFVPEIGVGECAGITLDVVGTVINEAAEKIEEAKEKMEIGNFGHAAYNAYSGFVIGAKALLLSEDHNCNTLAGIIEDFDEKFVATGAFAFEGGFGETVLEIQGQPTQAMASSYLQKADDFVAKVREYRANQIANGTSEENKEVIGSHYKA